MNERAIGCEEALRLLAAYLDHELDPGNLSAVSHHLERCRSCCSRAEFERGLKHQLGQLRHAAVGRELETRVRGLLHAFGAGSHDAMEP